MSSETNTPPLSDLRLRLNRSAYFGERIDITQLISQLANVAATQGWVVDAMDCPDGGSLPAFRKMNSGATANVYVSAGIHGDEPAGPMAVLSLLQQGAWPARFNYWVVPCLNPGGFERNTREGERGIDLNRDYRDPKSSTVVGHIRWLSRQPRFDLALLLHEDWEANGFYLYELNPDSQPSLAARMIEAVRNVCPIEHAAEVDGRQAEGGTIRFVGMIPDRADWPEALHLIHHNTRLTYTLEGPSDYPLSTRINALMTAVRAALDHLQPNGKLTASG